jgi:hypothetical protein
VAFGAISFRSRALMLQELRETQERLRLVLARNERLAIARAHAILLAQAHHLV